MENSTFIRETVKEDIPGIMSLERENADFVSAYPDQKHEALLHSPDCTHRSIFNGEGKLVGFFILMGCQSPNRELEFRRIAVSEKGKGHGRTALKFIKDYCFTELGFHRLWLDVFDDNKRAIGLYESEGFVQEALLRENVASESGFRSQRIYSMLEDEYFNFIKNPIKT